MKSKDFEKLQSDLRGMLPARVYERYYQIARNESRGSIIELGTGQGASTIAFALGVIDSQRKAKVIAVDQFFQTNPGGPHPASLCTHGNDAVAINLSSFRANLRRYGVEEVVELHVARTDQAGLQLEAIATCDVLAIDVDGLIDRDLSIFYDHIAPASMVIIDDYRNTVNPRGLAALERIGRLTREEWSEALDNMSSFDRRRLLGKDVLTYRLVEKLIREGLLEMVDVLGSTLFSRKIGERRFREAFRTEDAEAIERSVVHDFNEMLNRGVPRPSLVRRLLTSIRRRRCI